VCVCACVFVVACPCFRGDGIPCVFVAPSASRVMDFLVVWFAPCACGVTEVFVFCLPQVLACVCDREVVDRQPSRQGVCVVVCPCCFRGDGIPCLLFAPGAFGVTEFLVCCLPLVLPG